MNINRVLDALAMLGDYSDDDIVRYTPIVQKNLDLVELDGVDLTDRDESRIAFYVAAKTNYELALINAQSDGVTSFAAGDIKIQQTDSVQLAREIYDSASRDAAHIVGIAGDSGFCFRSV